MNNFFGQQIFASQYGSYAEDFDLLNRDGSATLSITIFFLVFFVGLFLGFISLSVSQPKKPEVNRTGTQNFLQYISIFLFIGSLSSLAYFGYLYTFKYLPQYYEWFDSLPDGAKTMITLSTIMNKFNSSK